MGRAAWWRRQLGKSGLILAWVEERDSYGARQGSSKSVEQRRRPRFVCVRVCVCVCVWPNETQLWVDVDVGEKEERQRQRVPIPRAQVVVEGGAGGREGQAREASQLMNNGSTSQVR